MVLTTAQRTVTELTTVRLHWDAEGLIKEFAAGVTVAGTVALLAHDQVAICKSDSVLVSTVGRTRYQYVVINDCLRRDAR